MAMNKAHHQQRDAKRWIGKCWCLCVHISVCPESVAWYVSNSRQSHRGELFFVFFFTFLLLHPPIGSNIKTFRNRQDHFAGKNQIEPRNWPKRIHSIVRCPKVTSRWVRTKLSEKGPTHTNTLSHKIKVSLNHINIKSFWKRRRRRKKQHFSWFFFRVARRLSSSIVIAKIWIYDDAFFTIRLTGTVESIGTFSTTLSRSFAIGNWPFQSRYDFINDD